MAEDMVGRRRGPWGPVRPVLGALGRGDRDQLGGLCVLRGGFLVALRGQGHRFDLAGLDLLERDRQRLA
jgi:hypothetical protein